MFANKNGLKIILSILILLIAFGEVKPTSAKVSLKWYQYYQRGIDYYKIGDWQRALNSFKASASLEFEERNNKRTYGMHFIKYYPHRYMAECYYKMGDSDAATREIDLSLAFQHSKDAEQLKKIIASGIAPTSVAPFPSQREIDYQEELNRSHRENETSAAQSERKNRYYSTYGKVPVGALTYDPDKVTQVGSRLSIAVMKFSFSGNGRDISNDVLNEMITTLYSLGGRFNIIEREKIQKIIDEQIRAQSGQIDDKSAVKAGKIAGVDAVLMGSISVSSDSSLKIWGRLINTETGKLITAQDGYALSASPKDINKACMDLSIKLYNDLPLVEGYVISIEPSDKILLDLGKEKHMKPDMQCVIYREGEKIKHPITGKIAYVKKIYLGEAVLDQVQESSSEADVIIKEKGERIQVGDKVVIK